MSKIWIAILPAIVVPIILSLAGCPKMPEPTLPRYGMPQQAASVPLPPPIPPLVDSESPWREVTRSGNPLCPVITERMAVTGGWIYCRITSSTGNASLVFVPDPTAKRAER